MSSSPDGKYIAFLMTHMNESKDIYEHDIQLLDIETKQIRELTQSGDVTAYEWISATEILFASKRECPGSSVSEFFVISIHGGEAQRRLSIPKACNLPVPLEQGKWLVMTKNETDPIEKREDRAIEGIDYWTFTDRPFIRNGEKFRARRRVALEIFDETDNVFTQITPRYFETAGYDISKDKKTIIYFGQEYQECATMFHSIYEYHLEKDSTEELIAQGKYQISIVKYLDQDIFVQASELDHGATQNHGIYLLDRKNKLLNLQMLPDSMYTNLIDVDAVYGGGRSCKVIDNKFIGARLHHAKTKFDEYDICKKEIREIASLDAFTSLDVINGKLYVVGLEHHELAELYQIDIKTGEKEKLTAFSEEYMKSHLVSVPEKFTFQAENGDKIDGFVISPSEQEEGKKYPGVLFIHGGPKWAYGEMFTHVMQCFASEGMYVLFCNPHGSDGYGDDFLDLTERWGSTDYEQVMEFTDECIKRYPGIDKERLGVTGGSYGGYLVNWIIGHTNRFKAAVSQRSISNLISTSLIIDIGDRILRQSCGKNTPWNHEEVLWEMSPLKYAKNVVTPTLFLHSDEDYRCYIGEAFQMFTALKQIGVDSELIVFHGENHSLSRSGRPSNRIVRVEEMLKWMKKYLQNT